MADTAATIEPIKKLIAFARRNGMPVIFTKFMSGNFPTHLWIWSPETEESHNCKRGYVRHYTDIDKDEQCADVIDELGPIMPEDYVIEKYNYSAFRNTNLVDVLESEGRDTIIVAGTVTQICVEDTIHDAFANSINVLEVSDGVSSFSELQQQASIENVANKYGMVMTSDEIIAKYGC